MHEKAFLALRVFDDEDQSVGRDDFPRVADLTAGLGVKRGAVEHDFRLLPGLCAFDAFAGAKNGPHLGFFSLRFVARKRGLPGFGRRLGVEGRRRGVALPAAFARGFLPLHGLLETFLIHADVSSEAMSSMKSGKPYVS